MRHHIKFFTVLVSAALIISCVNEDNKQESAAIRSLYTNYYNKQLGLFEKFMSLAFYSRRHSLRGSKNPNAETPLMSCVRSFRGITPLKSPQGCSLDTDALE